MKRNRKNVVEVIIDKSVDIDLDYADIAAKIDFSAYEKPKRSKTPFLKKSFALATASLFAASAVAIAIVLPLTADNDYRKTENFAAYDNANANKANDLYGGEQKGGAASAFDGEVVSAENDNVYAPERVGGDMYGADAASVGEACGTLSGSIETVGGKTVIATEDGYLSVSDNVTVRNESGETISLSDLSEGDIVEYSVDVSGVVVEIKKSR